jgi:type IV pilus assembly protein PilY1
MVYLPSNDGMLHGIDADSGVEKFAYLPRAILPNLYEYSEQGYVDKPLIEGHPTVRVIVPNTQKKYNNPVSVLASGFGSGAKGLFAIDVSPVHNTASNPVTASNVLFEFTEKDDPDMGYVVGQPSFVVLWTGEYTDANGKKRDRDETFVAVTSGYNNLSSKTEYDAEGKPKNKMYLFLLKTDRTYDKAWKEGTCDSCNYRKIEITDSDMKNVTNNGLTTPRIIGYGSRTVYFYMGDLQGNLWRYSYDAKAFTGVSDPYDSDLTVKKVFSSSNEATLRPITSKPTIALSKDGGFMISFGTGRYFGLNDLGSLKRSQQSLITIHDRLGDITLTLSNLNKREMRDGTKVTKVGTDNASNYKNGWYIDFALSKDSGERAIFSPRIKDNTVIFTTQILGKFEDNSCGTNSGSIAYVDLYEGTGGYSVIADKFVGEVIIMPAFKIAGSFNNQQMSTQGGNMLSKTYLLVGGGTDAASSNVPPTSMSINSYAVKGRLSWREIVKSGLQ